MGELECRISIGFMGLIGLFLGFVMGYEFFGRAYGDGGMVVSCIGLGQGLWYGVLCRCCFWHWRMICMRLVWF